MEYTLLDNCHFLQSLFKNDLSFDNILLHEIKIYNFSSIRFSLRFDLGLYPTVAPAKWAGTNTVQVSLTCIDTVIQQIKFHEGVDTSKMTISKAATNNKIVEIVGNKSSSTFLLLECVSVYIDGVTAYSK